MFGPCPCPRPLSRILVTLALAAGSTSAAGAWQYVIGEERADQQANLCESETAVAEIATIFRKFSPRTGYSALADSKECAMSVESFVPRRVVDEIVVAEGKPGEYRIRFVEVTLADGAVRYLVTTRNVIEP